MTKEPKLKTALYELERLTKKVHGEPDLENEARRMEGLYARSGDKRFLKAAKTLRGPVPKKPGNRKYNDEPFLVRMAYLLATGQASSEYNAAILVCGDAPGKKALSIAARLDDKFKKDRDYYRTLPDMSAIIVNPEDLPDIPDS